MGIHDLLCVRIRPRGLLSDCRRGRTGEQTYWHMGAAAFAVSESASQGTLFQSADKRQAERLPCRPKRAGRGYVLSAGKTTCRKGGCNGSDQSGKANAVGTEDEQSAKRRYGNRIKRAYLPLKLHKKGRCQQTAAFLISGVI